MLRLILDYCPRLKDFKPGPEFTTGLHKDFLKDYEPELITQVCASLMIDGKKFCDAMASVFKTYEELGIKFHHNIRCFEPVPDGIDFILNKELCTMERFTNTNIVWVFVSSDWQRHNATVADISLLGCTSSRFDYFKSSKTKLYEWWV